MGISIVFIGVALIGIILTIAGIILLLARKRFRTMGMVALGAGCLLAGGSIGTFVLLISRM